MIKLQNSTDLPFSQFSTSSQGRSLFSDANHIPSVSKCRSFQLLHGNSTTYILKRREQHLQGNCLPPEYCYYTVFSLCYQQLLLDLLFCCKQLSIMTVYIIRSTFIRLNIVLKNVVVKVDRVVYVLTIYCSKELISSYPLP